MSLTPSPNDEFEARITALLLGELSATEEEVVREAIAKDPAWAQLHARLQQTIGMVGEAARPASEDVGKPAATLRLSEERREKLLRSFKVIKPQPSIRARWAGVSMRDVSSVAAMLVVLGLLAWVLFFGSLGFEKKPQSLTMLPGGLRSATADSEVERFALTPLGERGIGEAAPVNATTDFLMDASADGEVKARAARDGRGGQRRAWSNQPDAPASATPAANSGLAGGAGKVFFANRLNGVVTTTEIGRAHV